jgi:hypothetical protein
LGYSTGRDDFFGPCGSDHHRTGSSRNRLTEEVWRDIEVVKKEGTMPKIKLNPIVQAISGKLGDIVFRVSKMGKVTIAKRPDVSRVVPSEARLARRECFKQAIEYARAAMAEREVCTVYEDMAAKEPRVRLRWRSVIISMGMICSQRNKPIDDAYQPVDADHRRFVTVLPVFRPACSSAFSAADVTATHLPRRKMHSSNVCSAGLICDIQARISLDQSLYLP